MDNIGKTIATTNAYLHRGQLLWSKAASDYDVSKETLLPGDYLSWLERLLPTLKPASRRQYIAATRELLLHLRNSNGIAGKYNQNLETAILKSQKMHSLSYSPGIKINQRPKKTSSQKAKRLEFSELVLLANNTKSMKGKWINPALIWMAANYQVGLRPCEWRNATLSEVDGQLVLAVLNAKNTNGRSHGLMRHLDVSKLKTQELKWVRAQLFVIKKYVKDDATWKTYYSGVRKTIHRFTRRLLSKRSSYPTLYSTRHQFAANAKSEGMSKVEVAAVLGHAVDETAGLHYGKKKHGCGSCRIIADRSEVMKVRENLKPKQSKSHRMIQC